MTMARILARCSDLIWLRLTCLLRMQKSELQSSVENHAFGSFKWGYAVRIWNISATNWPARVEHSFSIFHTCVMPILCILRWSGLICVFLLVISAYKLCFQFLDAGNWQPKIMGIRRLPTCDMAREETEGCCCKKNVGTAGGSSWREEW